MKKALSGEYSGYSVTVLEKEDADNMKKSFKESANSLIKEIKKPAAFAVSLVHEPCVRSAKFCSLKEKHEPNDGDKMDEDSKNIISALKEALNMNKKEEEESNMDYVTKSDLEELEERINTTIESALKEDTNDDVSTKEEDKEMSKEEKIEATKKKIAETEKTLQNAKNKLKELQGKEEEKRASKGVKDIHNNEKTVTKSGTKTVYEIMGRDGTGSMKQ